MNYELLRKLKSYIEQDVPKGNRINMTAIGEKMEYSTATITKYIYWMFQTGCDFPKEQQLIQRKEKDRYGRMVIHYYKK